MEYLPLILGIWGVVGAFVLAIVSDFIGFGFWSYAQKAFICLLCGPLGWLTIIVWCIAWCLSRFWKFLGSFGKK